MWQLAGQALRTVPNNKPNTIKRGEHVGWVGGACDLLALAREIFFVRKAA